MLVYIVIVSSVVSKCTKVEIHKASSLSKCHWNVNFLHCGSFFLKYRIASWLICLVMWANTRAVISLNSSQQENLAFFSELFSVWTVQ